MPYVERYVFLTYLLICFCACQLKAQLSKVTTETSAVTPSEVLRKVLREKQTSRNGKSVNIKKLRILIN